MSPHDPANAQAYGDDGRPALRRQESAPSEDGSESSDGGPNPTSGAQSKEHRLWPNPWMRKNWDPEHPLDLNTSLRDDHAPMVSDELEARSFQPAFAMDLNHLVKSLWTPRKPRPEPMLNTRQRHEATSVSGIPHMRRPRSGSPSRRPQPSFHDLETVRDTQRAVHDERRTVDGFEYRPRRDAQIDHRMSYDMAPRQRDPCEDPRRSYDTTSRPREESLDPRANEMGMRPRRGAPSQARGRDHSNDDQDRLRYIQSDRSRHYRYEDMESLSSRSLPDHMHVPSQRQAPEPHRLPTRYESAPHYVQGGGYYSDDNGMPRRRAVRQDADSDLRQDPYVTDRIGRAPLVIDRRAQGAARGGPDDPRRDPLEQPQLRRIASAPPESLSTPDRRRRDPRGNDREASSLSQQPPAHRQQRSALPRTQSEPVYDENDGSLEI